MSLLATLSALPSAAAWRRMAPMLLLMAAVLLLFRDTAAAMVGIWNRSDTFAHAFLVAPITVWLVWRRREQLARLPVHPMPWVLLPMAAVLALWLLAELASVNAATQFALVALLVLAVPATLGWAVTRALTFPLLFLFFMVPAGEFMVPYMMVWTADFAATAVRLSGIPIYREGLQFVIPSGNWSVVEACSGVRYLIASLMVGALFAYLNFQSPRRRALFMAASLVVPVVANWVRAYLIVLIGHLSGNQLAAGVDHIIYGWVFFGLVIGLMFMIGARWAEPDPLPAARGRPAARVAGSGGPTAGLSAWAVGAAALLLCLGIQGALLKLNRPSSGPAPVLALPAGLPSAGPGADAPLTDWAPAYANAVVNLSRSYGSGGNTEKSVGLWVAYYRDQGYDRKLVTSSNHLVDVEAHGDWAQTDSGSVTVEAAGGAAGRWVLRTGDLRGSAHPGTASAQRLRVWYLHWIGGTSTISDARARIQLAFNRLLGRGDDAAALFFYTPLAEAEDHAADERLRRAVSEALPLLEPMLAQAAHRP
jgi:exosortase A